MSAKKNTRLKPSKGIHGEGGVLRFTNWRAEIQEPVPLLHPGSLCEGSSCEGFSQLASGLPWGKGSRELGVNLRR